MQSMPDLVHGRDPKQQLATARIMLALFEDQIRRYDALMALNRVDRRHIIHSPGFDRAVLHDIEGKRAMRERWAERIAFLEQAISAAEPDTSADTRDKDLPMQEKETETNG